MFYIYFEYKKISFGHKTRLIFKKKAFMDRQREKPLPFILLLHTKLTDTNVVVLRLINLITNSAEMYELIQVL